MSTCKRFCAYTIISLLFASCYSKLPDKLNPDFKRFPEEIRINETKLLKIDDLTPDYVDLYEDSILCIVNGAGEKGHHFALYNLPQRRFVRPQLPAGRKAGQSLSFLSYGIEPDFLWSYDINKEKIIISGFDSLKTNREHFFKEVPVPGFYYSVQLINDSTLLASGSYDSIDNHQISVINLNEGKVAKRMASYSADSTAYNRTQKMAYESFLFLKPSKDKAVLACRYADRIEVVDLSSAKSKVIRGPEGYKPATEVVIGNDGKKISVRGPNTRYAFVRGEVTDQFIYLLYSGNKDGTPHKFYGKFIYIYDWDGKPVRRLELKNDTKDFAVTKNDSLIYCYDPKSKYISVSKIKN